MTKVKLKTVHKYKANQKNVLPFVGLVQFDETGVIEVEGNLANDLIQLMPEFSLVSLVDPDEDETPIKKKVEENDLGKGDDKDTLIPQTVETDFTGEKKSPVIIEEENAEEEQSSESTTETDSKQTQTPEQIQEALKAKSVSDLKLFLANYPVEETKELKNKEQYVAYLVAKLT